VLAHNVNERNLPFKSCLVKSISIFMKRNVSNDIIYCFREYTKNNDSLIVDTFQGQLQSKVKLQYFGSATLDIYCNTLTFNIFKT